MALEESKNNLSFKQKKKKLKYFNMNFEFYPVL